MPRKSSTTIVFHKMIFILEQLLRQPYQTADELCNKWVNDRRTDGYPFERKSFYNYRDQMQELFGVMIEKKKWDDQNHWYIENPEDLGSSNLYNWTISVFQVHNLVQDATILHDRILLDEFPSENGWLGPILEAMKNSNKLRLCYRQPSSEKEKEIVVDPFCIKQFMRRLYLIGRTLHNHITPFPLDRIRSIKPTKQKFRIPDTFDARNYYNNSFGIIVDSKKYPPKTIVLRAMGDEALDLKDLPLHHSQKIIKETSDYTDFSFGLSITDDLIDHILSRADRLIVLTPDSLAKEVQRRHLKSADIYGTLNNID